jgi:hypothetical protein
MDTNQQHRLQRFLSIVDTIHDFCDISRYPITNATNTYEKRADLRERIIHTLNIDIYDAMKDEVRELTLHPEIQNAQDLISLYDTAIDNELVIPKSIYNEDSIVDVIKRCFLAIGHDYITENEKYIKYSFEREEMTAEYLYEVISNLSGKRFIKYVIDKNQTDNFLFCVDPNIIRDTTNSSIVNNDIKPFIFKSRYKGLFDDFDNQRNKVSSNINNNSIIKDSNDCCHKDYVEYKITLSNFETLVLYELGTKNTKMFHCIEEGSDVKINFMKNQKHQGLSLFIVAITELNDRYTVEKAALQAISDMFGLRCDRYVNLYTNNTNANYVVISQKQFQKTLYDLKRGMDYLPVKATKNANNAFTSQDMIYFYVSSDRLAITYALLQGCPCIFVEKGGSTFHIYNPKGQVMVGGQLNNRNTSKQKLQKLTTADYKSYDYFMKLYVDELVTEQESVTKFDELLKAYKNKFKEVYIDCFWYIVYRFLFFMIE